MDEQLDVVVIGAGVVGLAVARALALRGRSVLVLERHPMPAQETTSRNSGVIHSGIYYPAGSLKAQLCVRGRQQLYDYAEDRGVAHSRCGKLIVANEDQLAALQLLQARAVANGVTDLVALSAQQVRELEPVVHAAAGLWCPSTGIIDVHELVQALIGDLEAAGGSVVYRTTLESAAVSSNGPVQLRCRSDGEELQISAALLVNSAGLAAVDLLAALHGYPAASLRKSWYAKGNYFTLTGAQPFRHLVYPMPDEAGLGIHATLDLDGAVRFGPNVEWVEQLDYSVDPRHLGEFYRSIRSYWPDLPDDALQPGYAGIRPKLVGPGAKAADFVIEGPAAHGCAGLFNLLGIESPGLTSSLAIGEHVAAAVEAGGG